MGSLRLMYRDVDRMPYLCTLRHCARSRGLDLELVRFGGTAALAGPTGQQWGDLLRAGEVDVIGENYWGLQSYRARGEPFLALASTVNVWTEKLLVDPSLRSLDDLRGTRFALRSVGPQALLPQRWLADLGLADAVEVRIYQESETGRWGHWRKVADGECQACFMTNVYAAAPLAAGLADLPYPAYPFDGGNVTLTTTESVVQRAAADVQRLVSGTFDATAVFRADRAAVLRIMREECADLLAEHFGTLDDEAMAGLYETLRAELAEVPVPTAEGISNARRIRIGTAPELDGYNPLLMWDLSFAREALRERAAA
jgi:hypothetical protein